MENAVWNALGQSNHSYKMIALTPTTYLFLPKILSRVHGYEMPKPLIVLNWLAVAFFAVTGILLAILQPTSHPLSLLNLIPFGSALIAAKPDSNRAMAWVAIGVNALWAAFVIVAIVYILGNGAHDLMVAVLFFAAMATPCGWNVFALWRALRAPQVTRDQDAPPQEQQSGSE